MVNLYNNKSILLTIFFMVSQVCFSQSIDLKKISDLIQKGENLKALKLLKSIDEKKLPKIKLPENIS